MTPIISNQWKKSTTMIIEEMNTSMQKAAARMIEMVQQQRTFKVRDRQFVQFHLSYSSVSSQHPRHYHQDHITTLDPLFTMPILHCSIQHCSNQAWPNKSHRYNRHNSYISGSLKFNPSPNQKLIMSIALKIFSSLILLKEIGIVYTRLLQHHFVKVAGAWKTTIVTD